MRAVMRDDRCWRHAATRAFCRMRVVMQRSMRERWRVTRVVPRHTIDARHDDTARIRAEARWRDTLRMRARADARAIRYATLVALAPRRYGAFDDAMIIFFEYENARCHIRQYFDAATHVMPRALLKQPRRCFHTPPLYDAICRHDIYASRHDDAARSDMPKRARRCCAPKAINAGAARCRCRQYARASHADDDAIC